MVADLRDASPGTQIVLLTMERDLSLARRAIDGGALGYLFKDAAHLELIEAVRAASEGRGTFRRGCRGPASTTTTATTSRSPRARPRSCA